MTEGSARVVIVGAGHAGGSAAALLRQYRWKGLITLIGAEPVPPYQRPPLSKAWLKGDSDLGSVLLRPAAFYAANDITLRLLSEATGIDRPNRALIVGTGERIIYDHLILATGARARALSVPGHNLAGVGELRTVADAEHLKATLRPGLRLAIIGGGYIGLEAAASARALGVHVAVIEREPRVLARVASPLLADFIQRRHEADGVRIVLNAAVEAFDDADGHVAGVRLSDGPTFRATPRSSALGWTRTMRLPAVPAWIALMASSWTSPHTHPTPRSRRSATARTGRCRCTAGPSGSRAFRMRWNRQAGCELRSMRSSAAGA